MDNVFLIGLILLGLCMGSFAGATVWRLRARQLQDDKESREEAGEREYKKLKPLQQVTLTNDRSRCLECQHTLQWYDLIPLISWLSTGGKCRYCHKKIGNMEPLIELGTATLFVSSYVVWANHLTSWEQITFFVLWLVSGVMLAILFAYDLRWYILPDRVVWPLVCIAVIIALLTIAQSTNTGTAVISTIGSVIILSGLYLVLWLISKGAWIGFGDVKLGLALGLLLADWRLAMLALFLANIIGCIVILPGMLMGKISRRTRVPFGPFLIIGMIIALFVGRPLIEWYLGIPLTW